MVEIPKLIPAKIRLEGKELFERIKEKFDKENKEYFESPEDYSSIRVNLEPGVITYMDSLDLEGFGCTCTEFRIKQICKHYVCMDYYYKSLPADIQERISGEDYADSFTFTKQLLETLEEADETESFKAEGIKLYLSAVLEVGDEDIQWTLKVRPEDSKRAYIIKNIANFVESVFDEDYYRISTKYSEVPLFIDTFDQASQDLIHYIRKVFLDTRVEADYWGYSFRKNRNCERYLVFPTSYFPEALSLFQALESFDYTDNDDTHYNQVYLDETPCIPDAPIFEVVKKQGGYRINLLEEFGDIRAGEVLIRGNHFYLIPDQHHYFMERLNDWLMTYRFNYPLDFSLRQKESLLEVCGILSHYAKLIMPAELEVRSFVPVFRFSKTPSNIKMDMTWDFGDVQISNKADLDELAFTYDSKLSRRIFKQLKETGFRQDFSTLSSVSLVDFFLKDLPAFRRLGEVVLDETLEDFYIEDPASIDVLDENGYLSVKFDFSMISEDEIDQALRALWEHESHYQTKQGQVLVFDDESLKVAEGLKDLRAKYANGNIQLHKSRAFSLSETFKDNDAVNFSRDFKKMAYDLAHPEEFDAKPYEVSAKLRAYQKEGLRWMSMLDHYRFGGILADDMGLGKTLQTITLLQSRLVEGEKALILAPASLLYNWKEEFRKFTPEMAVEVAYGPKASRKAIIDKQATITITSYQSFRSDLKDYQAHTYTYLILDEAQAVKNSQTKIAQALRDFNVQTCYALSGTPIENRLEEIWSIFQIVLPGLLPGKREFAKLSPQMVAKLIQPFILRRKKEEVVKELPPLTEHLYSNELTSEQKTLYLAQLKQMQALVAGASSEEIARHKIEILAGLTRLRQICNTPALFMEDYEGESGKMESLLELLSSIREKGSRPLIFSQFTSMLDIIEKELDKEGFEYFKITGQTPSDKRQEMVNAFNHGDKDCFLISLKAGGTGLNLTGADTVILCDLWWNPAVEMQAIGRSHRIGQTKQVDVYRLITLGTIEEKIQELQESKKELFNTVLEGQESKSNLSVDDIREILGVD